LPNITDQQRNFLRQLVDKHESTGGAEFILTWSMSGGGLSYPGGLEFRPDGDESDLDRLSRENLVDATRVAHHVHSGKPTQLGIETVRRSENQPPVIQPTVELPLQSQHVQPGADVAATQHPSEPNLDLQCDNREVTKPYKTALGRNIDRLRKECGWSFDELAVEAKVDKTLILGHVNQAKGMHPGTLAKYAQAFSKRLNRAVTVAELENDTSKHG
jgi:hypothetical protein